MYRELNSRLPGSVQGRRRALPNCVVAGVRGLVYGDAGERTGFVNQPDQGSAPEPEGLQESDHDDDSKENEQPRKATVKKEMMTDMD